MAAECCTSCGRASAAARRRRRAERAWARPSGEPVSPWSSSTAPALTWRDAGGRRERDGRVTAGGGLASSLSEDRKPKRSASGSSSLILRPVGKHCTAFDCARAPRARACRVRAIEAAVSFHLLSSESLLASFDGRSLSLERWRPRALTARRWAGTRRVRVAAPRARRGNARAPVLALFLTQPAQIFVTLRTGKYASTTVDVRCAAPPLPHRAEHAHGAAKPALPLGPSPPPAAFSTTRPLAT